MLVPGDGQAPSQIMSAREALNLVAFGVISPSDLTGEAALLLRWPISLNAHDKHAFLLSVLRMKAEGQSDPTAWPEADFSDPYSMPAPGSWGLQQLHQTASDLLERYDLTASEAAAELEAHLRYRDIQAQKMAAASRVIVRALAEGHLQAAGSVRPPGGWGIPPADYIPSVRFTTIGVQIWSDGAITFQDGSSYVGATFNRAEVMRLWPPRDAETYQPAIAPKKKSGGRNYRQADAPLVREMKDLVDQGTESSPWQAALRVSDRAAGSGSGVSRAQRLLKLYSETFSSERD